ncbi:hypothetical protein INR49_023233 [Caranx melampygus]|nr:hypothetical protein INR49_023233 [Caranx melampygus]
MGQIKRSKRPAKPKEEVEAENRRNTRTKVTPKITPQQEESSSPAGHHDSHSSVRSRKEGTLQKIGDFLQSSPTLLGSKDHQQRTRGERLGPSDHQETTPFQDDQITHQHQVLLYCTPIYSTVL